MSAASSGSYTCRGRPTRLTPRPRTSPTRRRPATTGDVVGPGFAAYLRAVFCRRPRSVVATSRLDRASSTRATRAARAGSRCAGPTSTPLGAYDQSARFRGWSGEDTDLLVRAVRSRLGAVLIKDRRFLRVVTHSDLERIALTEHDDAVAELARVGALTATTSSP
ncbi:MAG: hypothetical protein ACRYG2_27765 [Janthinobacterium lividum]